ncbi:phosphotransferase enzyme family protein [Dethiothermospora halolimnae]|uniref:phosphotransferase enzyme family protein n=1 Tax=Dethiothermospora halolimnae TaxID=3114390 RepID=UPI003CCC2D4F
MMSLRLISKILNKVDEEWRCPFVEDMIKLWGYDPNSVFYWRGSANFVFVFKKQGRTYYFRMNHSSERDIDHIKGEIQLLEGLLEKGMKVSKPTKSLNGKYIETFETELGTFYGVVFEGLKGILHKFEDLKEEEFYNWGKALGHLHHTMKKQQPNYNRKSWKDNLAYIEDMLCEEDIEAKKELGRVREQLESLDINKENFGLIHYDFELDNLIWQDNSVQILDFDDSAYYWYGADIAYALRDIIEGTRIIDKEKYNYFIKGYRKETDIDDVMLEKIPLFMRFHNLMTFARLSHAVDILDEKGHKESIIHVRDRLTDIMNNLRKGFAEEE